jgi:hypothetical protein
MDVDHLLGSIVFGLLATILLGLVLFALDMAFGKFGPKVWIAVGAWIAVSAWIYHASKDRP